MAQEKEQLLTITDVSFLLKMSPQTIRRYIKAGTLRAFRFQKDFRFHPSDIEIFMTGHAVNGAVNVR